MSQLEESRSERHAEDEMSETTREERETPQVRTGLVTSFVRHFNICSEIVKGNGSKDAPFSKW